MKNEQGFKNRAEKIFTQFHGNRMNKKTLQYCILLQKIIIYDVLEHIAYLKNTLKFSFFIRDRKWQQK
jgi:hypothetical protein